jgi:hypothetical protein
MSEVRIASIIDDSPDDRGSTHSAMSTYFNDTTHCYIPEGCHLHTRHHENLRSEILFCIILRLLNDAVSPAEAI